MKDIRSRGRVCGTLAVFLAAILSAAAIQAAEPGAITVPARLLTEFVNSLPPGQIDMELTQRTQTLNLKCARFEANIKGLDPAEFPNVPTADSIGGRPQGALHLKADTFKRMIDQVVFAAAADESRPILTGVLIGESGLHLVSEAVVTTVEPLNYFALGIIGEYIAKIYDEIKRRPPYLIESTVGINNTSLKDEQADVFFGEPD